MTTFRYLAVIYFLVLLTLLSLAFGVSLVAPSIAKASFGIAFIVQAIVMAVMLIIELKVTK